LSNVDLRLILILVNCL